MPLRACCFRIGRSEPRKAGPFATLRAGFSLRARTRAPLRMTRCGLLWRWGEEGDHLPRFTRRLPRGPERRPRYGIELDLNHQASDLTTMLMAIDRDDPHWNFGYRADLHRSLMNTTHGCIPSFLPWEATV